MRKPLILIATLLCLPALAQEANPPLPKSRPDAVTTAPAGEAPAGATAETPAVPLPRPRPAEKPVSPAAAVPAGEVYGPPKPETHAAEPTKPVVPRIYQTACPAVLLGRVEATALPPIADGQCHAQSPLSVTGVLANGRMVPVSGGVQTDCGVASALPAWVESVDSYLLSREQTRIAELVVGTSYMCRNVNGGSSGNLSFHGFADALDVVGFKLEDGRFVTVEGGWANATSPEGRLLRFAHDSACAQFTTVLGPEANAEHHDHLHVDLGCHGKTCTARLCE
jgi:hypothetical protein